MTVLSFDIIDQQLQAQVELLKNHDIAQSSSPSTIATTSSLESPTKRAAVDLTKLQVHENNNQPPPANGNNYATAPRGVKRPHSSRDQDIDPELRLGSGLASTAIRMMPLASAASGHASDSSQAMSSGAPIAPAPHLDSMMEDDGPGDGRKGTRELSQSKRAAQNRAAQVCSCVPFLDLKR